MTRPAKLVSGPEHKGSSEFVSGAYALNGDEQIIRFYSKWADAYDRQMLDELGYISPLVIAQLLHDHLLDKNTSIFDIGCGTGLTSIFLHRQGYRQIDGIDLSPDMVRVAQDTNIYRNVIVADVNKPLAIDDGTYGAAISSGTFTHGHVGPEPLVEIFRILRPEGILACTVHMDLWRTRGFEAKFNSLIEAGLIECLSLEKGRYYEKGELEGWFCIYRKL